MKGWAATRLVEAVAPVREGEPNPEARFLTLHQQRLTDEMLLGNAEDRKTESVPFEGLGESTDTDPMAPCWVRWRKLLKGAERPRISIGFYGLMAPRILPEDGDWILRAFKVEAARAEDENPVLCFPYLLATDWLMLHGRSGDWGRFRKALTNSRWIETLETLQQDLEKLKVRGPWMRPGSTLEGGSFGPDPADPWPPMAPPAGPGWEAAKVLSKPFYLPKYPAVAIDSRITATARVELDLDATGRPLAIHALPGYGLGVFTTPQLIWGSKVLFRPATIHGEPVPSRYQFSTIFAREQRRYY